MIAEAGVFMQKLTWLRKALLGGLILTVVVSCGRREEILPGERETIRPAQELLVEFDNLPAVNLGEVNENGAWTHRNGNSRHSFNNVAFDGSLNRIWSVNIGKGNTKKTRLTADPIVVGNRVYVMDSVGQVSAISPSGAVLWTTDLRPERDARDDISGGGLAFAAGKLIVSTGYGDVVALQANNGNELWRQRFQASLTAAPAVSQGIVIAVSVGNEAMGIDLNNGRVRWRIVSGLSLIHI